MLNNVYLELEDYDRQLKVYQHLKDVCSQIGQDVWGITGQTNLLQKENNRVFPNYYRVAFYGKQFGSKDNDSIMEEFIYRADPTLRLQNWVKLLEDQFGTAYGSSKVKILPNTVNASLEMEDENAIYIQVSYFPFPG